MHSYEELLAERDKLESSYKREILILNRIATSVGERTRGTGGADTRPQYIKDLEESEQYLPEWKKFLVGVEAEAAITFDSIDRRTKAGAITLVESLNERAKAIRDILAELALWRGTDRQGLPDSFLLGDMVTVKRYQEELAAVNRQLEALQANRAAIETPLDLVHRELQENSDNVIRLNANIGAGIIEAANKEGRLLEIHRETFSDLLFLLEQFRAAYRTNPTEGLNEAISFIESRLPEFRRKIRTRNERERFSLFDMLFPEGVENFNASVDNYLEDSETRLFDALKSQLHRQEEEIRDVVRQDYLERSKQAWLEYYNSRAEAANLLKDSQDELRHSQEELYGPSTIAKTAQYRDNIYRMVSDTRYAVDQSIDEWKRFQEELGVIILDPEAEFDEYLNSLSNSADEIRRSGKEVIDSLPATLEEIFDVGIPGKAKAVVEFLLTAGEALFSLEPGLLSFERTLLGLNSPNLDPVAGVKSITDSIATLITIVEQPFLRLSDILVSETDQYRFFIEQLGKLTNEELNEFYSKHGFDEDTQSVINDALNDYREVFSRVGFTIDANLFRILPESVRKNLEEAYSYLKKSPNELETFFNEIGAAINKENTTIASKVRETGNVVADNLISIGKRYGDFLTGVFGAIDAHLREDGPASLEHSTNLLRASIGELGTIFGVGSERAKAFFDVVYAGSSDSVLVAERITNNYIGSLTSLGFNLLSVGRSAQSADANISKLYRNILLRNEAFDKVKDDFIGADFVGDFSDLSGVIDKTSVSAEDLALSLASVVAQGGSALSVTSPILGQITKNVTGAIDALSDIITLRRQAARLPNWVGDPERVIKYTQEYERFLTLQRDAAYNNYLGVPGTAVPDISSISAEAQQVPGFYENFAPIALTLNNPEGEAFLASLGHIADEGKTIWQTLVDAGQVDILADAAIKIKESNIFEPLIYGAQVWSEAFKGAVDLVANHNRVAIQEMRYDLEEFRRGRREAEERVNEQLNREREGLRRRLDADLITLEEYYRLLDEHNANAELQRAIGTAEEIERLNKIQNAEYEAQKNQFHLNRTVAITDLIIGKVLAIANIWAKWAHNPIIAGALTGTLIGAGIFSTGALLAQKEPPKPPPITALAEGGVVTSPTLSLIGEAGPEAVIPLDRYMVNHTGNYNNSNMNDITVNVTVEGSLIQEDNLVRSIAKGVRDQIATGRIRRI